MDKDKKISALKQKKVDAVSEIKEKLAKTKALFVTDYRGLTHKQLEELRKSLKKSQAEFTIVKNTLLKKSLEEANIANKEGVFEHLKDSTAALFAYGDQIAAIKALSDFAKTATFPKVKIGLMDDNLVTAADFKRLAGLPPRDILLATLVARLNSPIQGLHYALSWNMQKFVTALNNIKSKKPSVS